MMEFGKFVSEEPHSLGAVVSVDLAVAKEGKAVQVALKRFHPPPSRLIQRVLHREAWRLSMERQQRAARSGAAALGVLALGSYPDGEYAVLPWRRRSLVSIVTSIRPTGDRLRMIISRLLDALALWEQHYGAPHGNLKPTNVFVVGEGALQNLHFELSDPSWYPGIPAARLRRQELAQLGALIVQMVRGRETGGAPIEDAPEWRRLGRAGTAWRDYANFLLDPHAEPSTVTLEAATNRLETIPLDLRPAQLAGRVGAGAALILGSATLGYARWGDTHVMPAGILWLAEKTGNPDAVRAQVVPEWVLLCEAWDAWVADLLARTTALVQTKDLWRDSDSLRLTLTKFAERAENLRPQALVPKEQAEGRSFASLAKSPPDAVRRERVVRHVLESWNAVAALRQELEHWARWDELRSLRLALGSVGKNVAVSGLQPLVLETNQPGSPMGSREAFNALSALARDAGARSLLMQWKAWAPLAMELAQSGDRVQAAMPGIALRDLPDTRNLLELATGLNTAFSELRRRQSLFLDPAVVRSRFLKESPLLSEKNEVVREDFTRWEREIALFSRPRPNEDPRAAITWETRLSALQASAVDLEDEIPAAEISASEVLKRSEFDRELGRIRSETTSLRARDLLRRDLPEVSAHVAQLQAAVQILHQRLDATLALFRPDRWLAGVGGRRWPYESVQQRWDAWQRERLANLTASVLERDKVRFRQLRREEHDLRDWLMALSGPTGLGTVEIQPVSASPETVTALRNLAARIREQTASAIISSAEWTGPLPRFSWSETLAQQSAVRQALADHQQWTSELPSFAAQLEELSRLLEEGMGWAEGISENLSQLLRHRGSDTLEGKPSASIEMARQIQRLAEANDRTRLVSGVRDGSLALALTAWRRLGDLADWPADDVQLGQEEELGTLLKEKVEKRVTEARRKMLATEIELGQRTRWLRLARAVVHRSAPPDRVFARATAFGVEPDALDPPMAYNLRLWRLMQQSQAAANLNQLRVAREEFVEAIQKLATLRGEREIGQFVKTLQGIALNEETTSALTPSPRQRGWKEEPSADGQRVVAHWFSGARKVALEYQLVEPADGTPAFFLGRRTLAVGEFIDLTAAHPEGPAILEAMPGWIQEKAIPPGDVMMAWRPRADGKGVELGASWFFRPSPLLKGQLDRHPAALARGIEERPTVRSPLQFVPPNVVKLFADQILGARLPTSAEWKSLCHLAGDQPPGNFRSATFEVAWRYAASVRSGDIALSWRPNAGAFVPALMEGGTKETVRDNGEAWPAAKTTSLWPESVDDGPVISGFIHLFGNVWVYLYDEDRKEYYVAGGSILSPPGIDLCQPQRILPRTITGRRGPTFPDGFTDVGFRPAFDAPPQVRQRLTFFRLVRNQPFLTN